MWDHPGTGTEPVSPALRGEFFTTEPPGRPSPNHRLLTYVSLNTAQPQPGVSLYIYVSLYKDPQTACSSAALCKSLY